MAPLTTPSKHRRIARLTRGLSSHQAWLVSAGMAIVIAACKGGSGGSGY